MRRRKRRGQSPKGDLMVGVLELSDVLLQVLMFVVRIPVLLLRLLS